MKKTLNAGISSERADELRKLAAEVQKLRFIENDVNGLRTELQNLTSSVLGPLFDTQRAEAEHIPIINLQKARDEKAVVYFCLPALVYPRRAAAFGKMVVNDLKYVTSTSRSPWRVVFDEFSIFAGPQVLNLLNQGRSYGLCVTLATQSIADIANGAENDGDVFVRQVFGSVNTYVIHRLNDAADCEKVAANTGTDNAITYTAQTIAGVGTGAASARRTREFLVHPDAIKTLDTGQAFVLNKNTSSNELITVRRGCI